jgi:fatty acid desaturase
MTGLDIFALVILIVLAVAVVGIWVLLGILPGKIARDRNHPQAEAISVCGWWGVITMGILLPLAFIWAYTKPSADSVPVKSEPATEDTEA